MIRPIQRCALAVFVFSTLSLLQSPGAPRKGAQAPRLMAERDRVVNCLKSELKRSFPVRYQTGVIRGSVSVRESSSKWHGDVIVNATGSYKAPFGMSGSGRGDGWSLSLDRQSGKIHVHVHGIEIFDVIPDYRSSDVRVEKFGLFRSRQAREHMLHKAEKGWAKAARMDAWHQIQRPEVRALAEAAIRDLVWDALRSIGGTSGIEPGDIVITVTTKKKG